MTIITTSFGTELNMQKKDESMYSPSTMIDLDISTKGITHYALTEFPTFATAEYVDAEILGHVTNSPAWKLPEHIVPLRHMEGLFSVVRVEKIKSINTLVFTTENTKPNTYPEYIRIRVVVTQSM